MNLCILNLDPTSELKAERATSLWVSRMSVSEKMGKLSHDHPKNVTKSFEITDNEIKKHILGFNNKALTHTKRNLPNPILVKGFN